MRSDWFFIFIVSMAGTLTTALLLLLCSRPLIEWVAKRFVKRLMTERYSQNIWEMVTAISRMSPRLVVENSLRADTGGVIERPFGSPKKTLNMDGLVFSPAQLAVLPSDENISVDTKIVIGPRAKKKLTLDIPLLLGGMGYGIGVTEKLRMAMAKGAAAIGTACNTGEGGFLPEERAAARYMILQYSSAKWAKDPNIYTQVDAIEIHIGQGATAAAASRIPPEFMHGKARDILGLQPGETAVIPSRHEGLNGPVDLKNLVDDLRQASGGVPIGVKIIASGRKLEQDLDICIVAGVDFIAIDGGQAGTKGGPPILQDDFGLPTIYALSRAIQHLEYRNVKDQISLLTGGGYFTPSDCLKALALGADAVFLGTAALWAMTHTQVSKTIPFEPPTQLVYYTGEMTEKFDEDEAAYYLRNFLLSFVEEMKIAVLALGKTAIHQVNKDDLTALDQTTSEVTRIPLAYKLDNSPKPS